VRREISGNFAIVAMGARHHNFVSSGFLSILAMPTGRAEPFLSVPLRKPEASLFTKQHTGKGRTKRPIANAYQSVYIITI
jgi:hypothetical protein